MASEHGQVVNEQGIIFIAPIFYANYDYLLQKSLKMSVLKSFGHYRTNSFFFFF